MARMALMVDAKATSGFAMPSKPSAMRHGRKRTSARLFRIAAAASTSFARSPDAGEKKSQSVGDGRTEGRSWASAAAAAIAMPQPAIASAMTGQRTEWMTTMPPMVESREPL